ncbi:hypothetical protein [Arthrobacter sp. B10-11]|uniref:hypothetical protein n=1 Tax=Arthrobacter sp. B10-11 TaxID=3081160 RepID=UPI002955753F|nr:hypothetical protein [Arthrobacter sp. B10-11]MDV8146988.1 hypothetical protein [Arthrobacter sp. B10-11]
MPLLAWPIWLLLRTFIPQAGNLTFGSPLIDLRILSAYVLLIPIWMIASRRGSTTLIRLICYSAYAACLIAVVAWSMARLSLLGPGSYPLVNIAAGAAQDVRPGGEILMPVLAVLLVFNRAPLFLRSRWLSFALLLGEILVSQTLSIVIASVAGILLVLLSNWHYISLAKRVIIIALLLGSGFVALSGGGSQNGNADVGSRFNLTERIGQNSAQYRVAEAETMAIIYEDEPLVLAVGTGPGSFVSFTDGLVHEVKDLTHNVYNNLILKTGIVGLVLFTGGFVFTFCRNWAQPNILTRVLFGSLGAIGVLSMTVPFVSTVSGLTALLCLGGLAVSQTVNARPARAGALN